MCEFTQSASELSRHSGSMQSVRNRFDGASTVADVSPQCLKHLERVSDGLLHGLGAGFVAVSISGWLVPEHVTTSELCGGRPSAISRWNVFSNCIQWVCTCNQPHATSHLANSIASSAHVQDSHGRPVCDGYLLEQYYVNSQLTICGMQVLYGVNRRLATEDVDSPLAQVRTVKNVAVCLVTGDRGLCGGYNNFAIKKVLCLCCCFYVLSCDRS